MERKHFSECHLPSEIMGENLAVLLKELGRILYIDFTGLIQVHYCELGSSRPCALGLNWGQILSPLLPRNKALDMMLNSPGLRVLLCK